MKGCHENRPEVSVVIPVYNAEKYLRQTMNYLLYQTLEEIEFIFVDDGSSDRSVTIIQEYMEQYKDKIYLYHTDHTGPGGARNKGIEHARADYIDGDPDKESNFTVLMGNYYAVLIEWLFQDNKEEVILLKDKTINSRLVDSLVNSLIEIDEQL